MADEHEHKFLVRSIPKQHLKVHESIHQGYLGIHPQSTTRVRIKGKKAFITVKGAPNGISRKEFEYNIPVAHARHMLEALIPVAKQVNKKRYSYEYKGFTFTVDVFEGSNQGLILAEVEVDDPSTGVETPPEWDLEMVTGHQYYNNELAINPYSFWKDKPLCTIRKD
jgi:adenylate cyclase